MGIKERLRNDCTINPETGCWEWQKYKDSKGYGQVRVDSKLHYCHRLSYEVFVAPITNGLFVLHKCDNPACINPEHLSLGTQQDNIRDCVSKGRTHGETGRAKETLTEEDFKLLKSRIYSDKEKAEKLGISRRMAQRIAERLRAGLSPY